jgi:hypothetical protein
MTRRRRLKFPRRPATRGLGVAAVALLVTGVIVSTLVRASARVHVGRTTSVAVTARPLTAGHAPPHGSPVSAAGLARARAAATSFANSYLRVAYGRAPARSIVRATSALRAELSRRPALVTPAERQRHPRVTSVQAFGEDPGFVLATAAVADGGVTIYALRITVQQAPHGWLVSEIVGG